MEDLDKTKFPEIPYHSISVKEIESVVQEPSQHLGEPRARPTQEIVTKEMVEDAFDRDVRVQPKVT